MSALDKITNIAERVIKCIQNTKWWQSIKKDDEISNKLLYEDDDVIGCLKVFGREVLKTSIVCVPVGVGVVFLYQWFAQEVVPKIIALALVIYFIIDSLKERKSNSPYTYESIYLEEKMNEIWEDLGMKVIEPIFGEPLDVMDEEGKFDTIHNAFKFTLVNEITDNVMVESKRQKINKKLAIWSKYPLKKIREDSIVSFNGRTIKIKVF